MSFDGLAELAFAEDFHGLHAAQIAGALVAHLRDEAGPGGEGVADEAEFLELVDEGFLPVEVLLVLERRDHHRRVVVVRGVHDDGIEITDLVREAFAVILQRPRVRKLFFNFIQLAGIHVAEAGPLDLRMIFQAVALQAADTADADLVNAKFAVRVGLRARGGREGGDGGGEHRAGAEKRTAGDGGNDGGDRRVFHGEVK